VDREELSDSQSLWMWIEFLEKDRQSTHRPSQSTETPDETKKRRYTLAFFLVFFALPVIPAEAGIQS
jgi:hypothetical protein